MRFSFGLGLHIFFPIMNKTIVIMNITIVLVGQKSAFPNINMCSSLSFPSAQNGGGGAYQRHGPPQSLVIQMFDNVKEKM